MEKIQKVVNSQKNDYIPFKVIQQQFKSFSVDWDDIKHEESDVFKFFLLPELQYRNQPGKIDKITLICLALLWCKDTDYQMGTKDAVFKELTKKNSIKYLLEKMIRISTVLVYGRLKDFGINCNTFLIDHEFEILNEKIKILVEMIYGKL